MITLTWEVQIVYEVGSFNKFCSIEKVTNFTLESKLSSSRGKNLPKTKEIVSENNMFTLQLDKMIHDYFIPDTPSKMHTLDTSYKKNSEILSANFNRSTREKLPNGITESTRSCQVFYTMNSTRTLKQIKAGQYTSLW